MIGEFIGSLDSGGAETLVLTLTRTLGGMVICRPDSWIENECIRTKTRVLTLTPRLEDLWRSKSILRYGWEFSRFLRENGVQWLHSHLYKAAIKNALAARLAGITHLATIHDSYTFDTHTKRRRRGLVYARALGTRLVAVSESVAAAAGVAMTVIPNGVDLPDPVKTRAQIRSELGISSNEFVIISVARLIPLKRLDVLIRSMEGFRLARLLIVGEGPESTRLQGLVESLHLESRVSLLGHRNDISDLLHASDCFALISETEGLSCAIIEALHAGLPCLVTDVGGNPELVDRDNGLVIVPTEDPKKVFVALENLASRSKEEIRMMRHESLLKAQRYSVGTMIESYLRLL